MRMNVGLDAMCERVKAFLVSPPTVDGDPSRWYLAHYRRHVMVAELCPVEAAWLYQDCSRLHNKEIVVFKGDWYLESHDRKWQLWAPEPEVVRELCRNCQQPVVDTCVHCDYEMAGMACDA